MDNDYDDNDDNEGFLWDRLEEGGLESWCNIESSHRSSLLKKKKIKDDEIIVLIVRDSVEDGEDE